VILVLFGLWKIPQSQVKPIQQQIDALKAQPKPIAPQEIAILEKSRIDAENAARTVLVQGIGGFFVFVTAGVAYLNFRETRRNVNATERNVRATEEKQIAERFGKAVELLGSEKIHARLGGIYALEQIAKDAEEKYYWQVMETLTSYVREESPLPESSDCRSLEELKNVPLLSEDVQTAMTVLARREHLYNSSIEPHRLNLSFTDLRRLRIPDGLNANFDGANFTGSKLHKARLTNVSFKNTLFFYADLKEAHFYGAQLQKSNLIGADLRLARLQDANLEDAELNGANLICARLRAEYGRSNVQGLLRPQISTTSYHESELPDYLLQNLPVEEEAVEIANPTMPAPSSIQNEVTEE